MFSVNARCHWIGPAAAVVWTTDTGCIMIQREGNVEGRMIKALAGIALMTVAAPLAAETHGQRVVAAVLLCEARSEGRSGMIAVAEVIRKRADLWKISPLAVVKKDKHFSCLNSASPEGLVREYRSLKEWPDALNIARLMYNQPDRLPGFSNGATHYHSQSAPWAAGKQPVAVVGKLKFYKLDLP